VVVRWSTRGDVWFVVPVGFPDAARPDYCVKGDHVGLNGLLPGRHDQIPPGASGQQKMLLFK